MLPRIKSFLLTNIVDSDHDSALLPLGVIRYQIKGITNVNLSRGGKLRSLLESLLFQLVA